MGQMYCSLKTHKRSHAKLRLMCAILTNGGAMQTHG
jgi:hypothetical protein